MADLFVASSGSNTSPYETWAKAATSLQTALTAATGDGDNVIIQYDAVPSTDSALAADTTYTFGGHTNLISASNDGGSAYTPTPMGAANWIGHTSSARSIYFAGVFRCYIYGLTLRIASSSADHIELCSSASSDYVFDECYLWQGCTSANGRIYLGDASNGEAPHVTLRNCTYRFGHTGQGISIRAAAVTIEGGSVSSAGSIPSDLFKNPYSANAPGNDSVNIVGMDLSNITGTLVGDQGQNRRTHTFIQCKLGSGVTPLASQSRGMSGAEVYLHDTAIGDVQYGFGHFNALGSTVLSTSVYANDGASYDGTNRYSWVVASTSIARFEIPYVSPWIDRYNATLSSQTPSFEILRDGSATAYTDGEVWGEWLYKATTGYSIGTIVSDRKTLRGSAANQATSSKSASDWTGEGGTAWFGTLSPGAITPAEIGSIGGRICIGAASTTVYVDPQVRLA